MVFNDDLCFYVKIKYSINKFGQVCKFVHFQWFWMIKKWDHFCKVNNWPGTI